MVAKKNPTKTVVRIENIYYRTHISFLGLWTSRVSVLHILLFRGCFFLYL